MHLWRESSVNILTMQERRRTDGNIVVRVLDSAEDRAVAGGGRPSCGQDIKSAFGILRSCERLIALHAPV